MIVMIAGVGFSRYFVGKDRLQQDSENRLASVVNSLASEAASSEPFQAERRRHVRSIPTHQLIEFPGLLARRGEDSFAATAAHYDDNKLTTA